MKKETLSTSEKEVPKINLGLEEKYKEEAKTLHPAVLGDELVDVIVNIINYMFYTFL